jgi:hypothetical protein
MRFLKVVGLPLILLFLAGPLWANAGTPILLSTSPLAIAVVTPMIAVLERPFATWAGVRTKAYLHCLIANVLSTLLGLVGLWEWYFEDFASTAYVSLGVALTLSIVSEGLYYRRIVGKPIRWLAVVLGNVITLIPLGILSSYVGRWA